jgi:uncharacterized protein (TIRG00374 family)
MASRGTSGTLRQIIADRTGLLLLQVAVGIVSIALLVWRVDVVDGFRQLPHVNYFWALPALLLFTASRYLYGYRWRLFMNGRNDLPLNQLTGIFILANLLNATIPFRAGDVLRIQMPNRRYGIPRSELTSNVMVTETMLDAVAFVLLLLLVLPFVGIPVISRIEVIAGILAVLVAFGGLIVLAKADRGRDFGGTWMLRPFPGVLRGRIAGWIPGLLDGLDSLRHMRRLGLIIVLSVAVRLMEASVYWMIGEAFNLDLPFAAYVVVMVAVGLVVTMPLVPWNIGPYEVALTEVLVLMAASRTDASAFAIGSHLLLIAWMSVTGIAAMVALRLRVRDLI